MHQEFLNLSLALYKIRYLYTWGWGLTPIWKRQRCSSKILKLTPKGDQSELKIEFILLNLFPKTLNETLKVKSILGFHVTSEKTKIKKNEFLHSSAKRHFQTYIWWPVFSLVACFVLKIEQFEFQIISQYVTSALFLSNITGSPRYVYEYRRIQYIDSVYCYVIWVICIFIKFLMRKNNKAEN